MFGWWGGKNIYIKKDLSQKHVIGQRKQVAGQYVNFYVYGKKLFSKDIYTYTNIFLNI